MLIPHYVMQNGGPPPVHRRRRCWLVCSSIGWSAEVAAAALNGSNIAHIGGDYQLRLLAEFAFRQTELQANGRVEERFVAGIGLIIITLHLNNIVYCFTGGCIKYAEVCKIQ